MSPGRLPSKRALQHSLASAVCPLADMDMWSRLSPSDVRISVGDWNRSMNGNLARSIRNTPTGRCGLQGISLTGDRVACSGGSNSHLVGLLRVLDNRRRRLSLAGCLGFERRRRTPEPRASEQPPVRHATRNFSIVEYGSLYAVQQAVAIAFYLPGGRIADMTGGGAFRDELSRAARRLVHRRAQGTRRAGAQVPHCRPGAGPPARPRGRRVLRRPQSARRPSGDRRVGCCGRARPPCHLTRRLWWGRSARWSSC